MDATDLIMRFRELSRSIWNNGFWQIDHLREGDLFVAGDYRCAFQQTVARLYEGVVLLPLRQSHSLRMEFGKTLGDAFPIAVQGIGESVPLLVDRNLPAEPSHCWDEADVPLVPGQYDFRFVGFFDWDEQSYRDFQYVEVLIERMDSNPLDVGHHGVLPALECRFAVK